MRRQLQTVPVKLEMERKCCMCREVLPLDRRRKRGFHSKTCESVKATVRDLLSVPLEEIGVLNESTATIYYISLSNTSGKIAYIKDFPYPVGKDTKVSCPSTNAQIASFCFSFKLSNPRSFAQLKIISFISSIPSTSQPND